MGKKHEVKGQPCTVASADNHVWQVQNMFVRGMKGDSFQEADDVDILVCLRWIDLFLQTCYELERQDQDQEDVFFVLSLSTTLFYKTQMAHLVCMFMHGF